MELHLSDQNLIMKNGIVVLIILGIAGCKQPQENKTQVQAAHQQLNAHTRTYEEIKKAIIAKRKLYAGKYSTLSMLDKTASTDEITNYWVATVGTDLYNEWEGTPWDFNGITTEPRQGTIACGYFVSTILKDMGLNISRQKLAVCPSSEMMRSLTPKQQLKNLSYLSYEDFCKALDHFGKGVYIIGLDFHTGIIVNDGKQCWLIHSNYIRHKGVMKEPVLNCAALRSSKTRWLISLTGDKKFLFRWLHSN